MLDDSVRVELSNFAIKVRSLLDEHERLTKANAYGGGVTMRMMDLDGCKLDEQTIKLLFERGRKLEISEIERELSAILLQIRGPETTAQSEVASA